uniref:Uncharacterized protein n=1 Tax=Arundo donax TaxID=35708 RepID=A0A0A9BVF4_ARUDO
MTRLPGAGADESLNGAEGMVADLMEVEMVTSWSRGPRRRCAWWRGRRR